jgi:hypothetical protein
MSGNNNVGMFLNYVRMNYINMPNATKSENGLQMK